MLRSAARALRHRQGGLHIHPTCLSMSALLTAGNVTAPATDPCPGWSPNAALPPPELAHGQPGTQQLPPPLPPPMLPPRTTVARDPALDLHGAPVSFATGGASPVTALNFPPFMAAPFELELGLIQTQMAQKPMFQTEVCACVARELKKLRGAGCG